MAHRTWCDDIVCSMWEHIAGLIIRGMLNDHPRTLRNLQNLPATGSKYAKVIKKMFKAPPGWLFVGLDYASLEDRISALTTKDPAKLQVYTDGFDGHCLRAHAYFGEKMPDVQLAPEGVTCYKANVGDTDIYFHAEEVIEYLGQTMTGKELYDLLQHP